MYEFLDYQTHDVMTTETVTIAPDATLAEAEALFEKHEFNGMPVLDAEGHVVGMLTQLDLLRAFAFTDESLFPPYTDIMQQPVSRVMTRDLQTVNPRTPLSRVLQKMLDARSKSFPVLAGDRLVGVVSREDVRRGLRRAASGERPSSTWTEDTPT